MNNNKILFWASFFTLIAAGAGFAIRGVILADWSSQFGFTMGELGQITGGGLTGFGVVILLGSLIADRIGYKTIMVAAFVLHLLSAAVTLAATPVYAEYGRDATYWCLFIGMFMFAVANGLCESVINPLVATIYPKQKTHYLNILHAGWPGGLIVGGVLGYLFAGPNAQIEHLRWEIPMAFFLVPVFLYGFMILKEKFPVSEATAAGVDFGTMLKQFVAPLFLFLLVLQAMVGYVELGTDSWITNIMRNVIEGKAILLFIYTSTIMFVLRFFAGPIVERINPIGLLFLSAVFAAIGLYWLGMAGAGFAVVAAATIYGLGKTFFWPTMLGVVGERFPKGGALTMGAVGGIGMLSAGLLGGPGIGLKQDYYASQNLKEASAESHERYVVAESKAVNLPMLPEIRGLDGQKVGVVLDGSKNGPGTELADTVEKLKAADKTNEDVDKLAKWWKDDGKPHAEGDKALVSDARLYGGRMALKLTALVPLMMAIGYLILIFYFRSKGGYQQEVLQGEEQNTGGDEGPNE